MADTLEVAVEVDVGNSVSDTDKLANALGSLQDALRGVGEVGVANLLEKQEAAMAGVRAQAQTATAAVNAFRSALTQASRVQLISSMANTGLSAYSRQIDQLQSAIAGRTASAGGTGRSGFTREEESSLRIQKEMVRLANEEYQARMRNVTAFRAFRQETEAANVAAKQLKGTFDSIAFGPQISPAMAIDKALGRGTGINAQNSAFNALPANFAARDELKVQLAAQRELISVLELEEQQMYRAANARYAYFAAGAAIATGSAVIIAANIGVIAAAAEYESAFASIQRTSESTAIQMQSLRAEFTELAASTALPFADLAEIGSLAGQLNIPRERIIAFTEAVGQFGATTDVTSASAAEAFGRLDALIDNVDGNYEALGSSILQVGINSVATESDIVALSTSIAAVAGQANFTAQEIIGFSAAMASMGIRPELARGALTRVFGQVSTAIAEGGAALEEFGRVSGLGAQQFEQAWGNDTAGTFETLLQGVERLSSAGEDSFQIFQQLGIINSRDIDVLSRMSQNYDILAESLQQANAGWDEQTALQNAYEIQANTVNGRLQILQNSFQAMIATFGAASSGPIMGLFEGLTNVMNGLRNAVEGNPVLAQFIGIAGAASALVGVLGAATGAFLLFRGSMLAITQATQTQRLAMAQEKAAFMENRLATDQVTASKTRLAGALNLVSGAFARSQFAATQNARAMLGVNASSGLAARGLSGVLGLLGGPWGIALTGAAVGVTVLTAAIEDSQAATDEWAAALEDGAHAADLFSLANQGWDGIFGEMDFDFDGFTGDFNNLITAMERLRYQQLTGEPITLEGLDVSTQQAQTFTHALGQIDSNLAALDPTQATLAFQQFAADMSLSDASTEALIQSMPQLRDTLLQAGVAADEWTTAQRASVTDSELVAFANSQIATSADDAAAALYYGADAADEYGNAASGAANMAEALQQALAGEFALPNSLNAAAQAAYNMGSAIADSSGAFNILDASGQGAVSNLLTSVQTAIIAGQAMGLNSAESVSAVFSMLQAQGVNTAALLASLAGMGVTTIGGVDTGSIQRTMQQTNPQLELFRNLLNQSAAAGTAAGVGGGRAARGARDAGRAAREAAVEVRTLVDYASDLGKVFDRSFEIQFGASQGQDKITGMWLDIQDSIDQANESMQKAQMEIRGINAEIASLTADKAILEYFQEMAVAYDDVLRQGDIGGEIGKINAKIAEEQSKAAAANGEMVAAQAEMDKGLNGNSRSAIENRETILNLVGGYQDYLQALAASGADQATLNSEAARLRAEFMQQATQLGFNQTELAKYAVQFDNVTTAIGRVPRNITVSANTNPALQALAEFEANATSRMNNAGYGAGNNFAGGFNAGVRGLGNDLSGIAALLANLFNNSFRQQMGRNPIAIDGYLVQGQQVYRVPGTGLKLFSSGGYTGGEYGKKEAAGIVHGQEYVVNAENTKRLGVPFLNALNSGKTPMAGAQPVMGGSSRGGGTMVVELSAYDRQLLAQAGNVQLRIGNKDIAQAGAAASISMANRGGN